MCAPAQRKDNETQVQHAVTVSVAVRACVTLAHTNTSSMQVSARLSCSLCKRYIGLPAHAVCSQCMPVIQSVHALHWLASTCTVQSVIACQSICACASHAHGSKSSMQSANACHPVCACATTPCQHMQYAVSRCLSSSLCMRYNALPAHAECSPQMPVIQTARATLACQQHAWFPRLHHSPRPG